jgi:hypothetical protein
MLRWRSLTPITAPPIRAWPDPEGFQNSKVVPLWLGEERLVQPLLDESGREAGARDDGR